MPRNLVICCDGTNNQFGRNNTNVVRLVQALDRDQTKQRLYYDPGVGTLAEPGAFTAIAKWMSQVGGLAFGAGLTWKIRQAYCWLMDAWEPGDQVFLFGFSRGAYSVRVLAALLHAIGLLPRGNDNLVPYASRLFKAVATGRGDKGGRNFGRNINLCNQFRRTFARAIPDALDEERRFPIHFLGVWDTVSSVGWVWDPARYAFTACNPSIRIARHAVSIDERRCFFRQNLLHPWDGQDVKELWFPGVHCDVGGGYPEANSGLWRLPFRWMVDEAVSAGLAIKAEHLQAVLDKVPASERPWTDVQQESLKGLWWPAEFFPKLQWRAKSRRRIPVLGLGRHRRILDGALIHKAALLRIRDTGYAPPNLSSDFLQMVSGIQGPPESVAYDRQGAAPKPVSPAATDSSGSNAAATAARPGRG